MTEFEIDVEGDNKQTIKVINGFHRLRAAISAGIQVIGIDQATGKRYKLRVIGDQVRGTELLLH